MPQAGVGSPGRSRIARNAARPKTKDLAGFRQLLASRPDLLDIQTLSPHAGHSQWLLERGGRVADDVGELAGASLMTAPGVKAVLETPSGAMALRAPSDVASSFARPQRVHVCSHREDLRQER